MKTDVNLRLLNLDGDVLIFITGGWITCQMVDSGLRYLSTNVFAT